MSAQAMQPRLFTTSMAADFFTVASLETQTGFAREWFPDVVLKELLDNAADACETVGVPPRIGIAVDSRDDLLAITVTDNGAGMDPDAVASIVDFSSRTSDKAAYRKPSRGAQGHAVKTVLGIVTALGAGQPLLIESRGVRHEIAARLRPGGFVDISHETSPCAHTAGTMVRAVLHRHDLFLDGHGWVRCFALFNPHATFTVTEWQESDEPDHDEDAGEHADSRWQEVTTFYRASVSSPQTWRKFVPTDAASPHWYTAETMRLLVDAYIASDRMAGLDTPVRTFVREFRGLSSTQKAAAVMNTLPGIRCMADLEDRPGSVDALHAAMIAVTSPAKPEVLGSIGGAHLTARLGAEPDRSWYQKVAGLTQEGQPFVIEVALAATEQPGGIVYGVEFQPDPRADRSVRTLRPRRR